MQQIATTQKEIATGALPIDVSAEMADQAFQGGEAFQSVLGEAKSALDGINHEARPAVESESLPKETQSQTEDGVVDIVVHEGKAPSSETTQKVSDEGASGQSNEFAPPEIETTEEIDVTQIAVDEMLGYEEMPDVDWVAFVDSVNKQLKTNDVNDASTNDTVETQPTEELIVEVPVTIVQDTEAEPSLPIPITPVVIEAITNANELNDAGEIAQQDVELENWSQGVVEQLNKLLVGAKPDGSVASVEETEQADVKLLTHLVKDVEVSTEAVNEEPSTSPLLVDQIVAPDGDLKDLAVKDNTLKGAIEVPLNTTDEALNLVDGPVSVVEDSQKAINTPTEVVETIKQNKEAVKIDPVEVKINVTQEMLATNTVEEVEAEESKLATAITPVSVSLEVPSVTLKIAPQQTKGAEQPIEITVKPEALEHIAEHIVQALPETVDKQAATSAIVGQLNAAVQELANQKANGREPGINLKSIASAALKENDIVLTPEQQQVMVNQVAKTEQLVSVVQSVSEASVSASNSHLLPAMSQSQHSQQSMLDQQFITAVDRNVAEASINVQEQTKATQTLMNQADKAVPLHQPEGQKQVAEKIRWMVNGRVTAAEIRLDPPELGSMQIRVNMSGDTASVSFIVQSAQARDLLADATPRLRDMLSEQGIDLGESFVAQQDNNASENGEGGNGSGGNGANSGSNEPEVEPAIVQSITRPSIYNIDAFV